MGLIAIGIFWKISFMHTSLFQVETCNQWTVSLLITPVVLMIFQYSAGYNI